MWILGTAVLTASLLGSMHCVGMCGPLAIWASGTGQSTSRRTLYLATSLYHLGRLLTYAIAGFLAGMLGQLTDIGGSALGVQLLAARIAGLVMIAAGLVRLWQLSANWRRANWRSQHGKKQSTAQQPAVAVAVTPLKPSGISGLLIRLRPIVFRLPIPARGLATGLLTAFLPCGWLYIFALFAAGTGDPLLGTIVMSAFWLGSVPALVGLVAGSAVLARRWTVVIPAAAAIMLIIGGVHTASGRGFAALNSLSDIAPSGLGVPQPGNRADSEAVSTGGEPASKPKSIDAQLDALTDTPLPCCQEHSAGEQP